VYFLSEVASDLISCNGWMTNDMKSRIFGKIRNDKDKKTLGFGLFAFGHLSLTVSQTFFGGFFKRRYFASEINHKPTKV
jgi:hypothetical protein